MDNRFLKELNLLHTQVCQALGDPKRLLILYALSQQPRYVSELAEELQMPQPTISRHLRILRDRCLVTSSRKGHTVYYEVKDMRLIQALNMLRALLQDRLAEQAQLVKFEALDGKTGQ